ncbi:MAG TPA: hypothetical protein VJ246_02320 [Patescibacteria group bacterium]|nr:hypothetical protein [Patescibacteria group bacterium]
MRDRPDTAELWVHVDINSYFATLVQQENPVLRGKPVGILKSVGRTCVIAASKEAKACGVETGCRLQEAKKLCPNLIAVPAAFELYWSATHRLHALFQSFVPDVELFSLDEAFLNLSPCTRIYPNPYEFGRLIQQKIRETLGEWVTCNVGIAHSRLVAKMASEVSGKGSVTVVTKDDLLSFLANTPFKDVCGVGRGLERRLNTIGVTSLLQLHFIPDDALERAVGPFWIRELRKMSCGEDPAFLHRVETEGHMKSVGRTMTGYGLCHDETVIRRTLLNLTTEVVMKVRTMGLAGRYVGVFLEGREQSWADHRTLPYYIQHTKEMFQLIYQHMYHSWTRTFPILRFGVSLSHLKPQSDIQQPLLPEWHKQERIERAITTAATKFGLFTVRPATMLDSDSVIRPEVTGYLGDKKYRMTTSSP